MERGSRQTHGVELLPGYRIRPARDDDAPAAVALTNEESEALIGTPLVSTDWMLRHWTAPSVDRERDVAVVEAPAEQICGWLSVLADPPYTSVFAIGVVGLAFHGRGLGAAIVLENERRAQRFLALADQAARVVVHAGALADEPRATALLASQGYREVRRMQLMRVDFTGEPPPPADMPGIDVRAVRAEDARELYAAHREAFADHWGDEEETYEDFRHHLLDRPEFDPDLWFLAWDGDVLAGYLGAEPRAAEDPVRGYVHVLGVRRHYRGRGIGEMLLRHAFRALYARRKQGCDLHVDSASLTGATRLYARVGMTAYPRFATWEKELRPAAGSAADP
jgi:mycothiol synthase